MSREKQKELRHKIAPFEHASVKAGIKQLINTVVPFLLIWFLAYKSLAISFWLALPLIIIAAGFIVRIFIIFHDCTHQSFFNNKKANKILGTCLGIITHFPFEKWKRSHTIHHATSGNLDKRGTGDIWIMTVEEYVAASFWTRLSYKIYRNPIVMFGLGPLFLFLVSNRFNRKGANRQERVNTYIINAAIAVVYTILIIAIGWKPFLLIQVPMLFISGIAGIWLFYVQHQFEDSYFENEDDWDYVKAAIDGSSYYKLPKVLQWMTGSIGFHHVHHLSPRVPNYFLEKVHECTPPLQQATTITLASSLKAINFRLYDKKNKSFVTFKEIKHLLHQQKREIAIKNRRLSMQNK